MLSGTIEMLGGTVGMLAPGGTVRMAWTVGMLSRTAGMLWVGKLGC